MSLYLQLLRVDRISTTLGATIEAAAPDATDTSAASEAAETATDGEHQHSARLEPT